MNPKNGPKFATLARVLNAGVSHVAAARVFGSTSHSIVGWTSQARRLGFEIIPVRKEASTRRIEANQALVQGLVSYERLYEVDAVFLIAEAGTIDEMFRMHWRLVQCDLIDPECFTWLLEQFEGRVLRMAAHREGYGGNIPAPEALLSEKAMKAGTKTSPAEV